MSPQRHAPLNYMRLSCPTNGLASFPGSREREPGNEARHGPTFKGFWVWYPPPTFEASKTVQQNYRRVFSRYCSHPRKNSKYAEQRNQYFGGCAALFFEEMLVAVGTRLGHDHLFVLPWSLTLVCVCTLHRSNVSIMQLYGLPFRDRRLVRVLSFRHDSE